MLKKFQMEDSSTVSTPMVVGCKLIKDDISPDVDQRTYRSMIGMLEDWLLSLMSTLVMGFGPQD
jgi:hypothetical protein